ncbi:MAG: ankyrin repeat domain-containing protein, partial [Pseudomonadota bacterium]
RMFWVFPEAVGCQGDRRDIVVLVVRLAIRVGALDVVELLLEAGADANGKAHYKNNDIAAISLAAYRFRENPEHPSETHLAIMRVLLRHGADESVQGPDGQVLGRARTLYPEIDTPA